MAAAAVQSCVLQQPVDDKGDEEIINSIISLILYITGYPPVDANHIYRFKRYMDKFLHPCPSMRRNTGGTLPIASSCEPIAESLHGWGDVLRQDLNSVQDVFQFFSVDDQRLAYDVLLRKLGRAPRVLEFSRFLLIFQGNHLTDSSRKTLGQLVLENERNETLIQALRQSNNQNMNEVDTLQNQKRNLERIICNIQLQKADLQLEYNALKRSHDQHLAELEDERKDKQQLQADKQALVHIITAHERNIDRLRDTVKDLRQQSVTISNLESKNSDLESMTEQQSVSIAALETKLQQQNQRQQYMYFFLFLAALALIFAMVC